MKLPLTPQMVVAAYEYLRTTPPFCSWKLPHSDDIEFRVTRHADREGHYTRHVRSNDHFIVVSGKVIKATDALMQVTAHEMAHLRQALTKRESRTKYMHNADYWRMAERICTVHGWDTAAFVGTPRTKG